MLKENLFKFNSHEYDFTERTYIMGILNVTPDSFSDAGEYFSTEKAVDHALRMIDEGADFIDIGGESTKPGSDSVPVEVELERVIPVVRKLNSLTKIPISIDTTKSVVAEKALESGATIINDISSLRNDIRIAEIAGKYDAAIVLMHMKGNPKTMQNNPEYENLIDEIKHSLQESIDKAERYGVKKIFVDPGIGFGKNVKHNIEILKRLNEFKDLKYPVLIGPSRKSFIGNILNLPVDERLEGTAAAIAVSIMKGANVVRVHDVKEMKRVAKIVDALK